MKYRKLVISRIETDIKNEIVVMTFFPSRSVCIKPRPYERITALWTHDFEPEIELAEAISEKGRKRLKLLIKHPTNDEDERRARGDAYYSQVFGRNCGNDETQKGIADALNQMMMDLYYASADTADAWTQACEKALDTVVRSVRRGGAGRP